MRLLRFDCERCVKSLLKEFCQFEFTDSLHESNLVRTWDCYKRVVDANLMVNREGKFNHRNELRYSNKKIYFTM